LLLDYFDNILGISERHVTVHGTHLFSTTENTRLYSSTT